MDSWDIKLMIARDCLDILMFKELYRQIKIKERK